MENNNNNLSNNGEINNTNTKNTPTDMLTKETGDKANNILSNEEIEANKDTLNFKPDMKFILEHINLYEKVLEKFENAIESDEKIEFDKEYIGGPLSDLECKKCFRKIPEVLRELSTLKTITYKWQNKIFIPKYKENGEFSGQLLANIDYNKFPRKKGDNEATEDDHPHRILVGITINNKIGLNSLPLTLIFEDLEAYEKASKEDKEKAKIAFKAYQTAVLFHEFFHTVEKQFRDNSEKREKIRLKTSNLEEYTLENWWKDFEDYVLNPDFKPVTRYASTYKNELNEKTKINNNGDYIYSLGEQMAETFAGYMLGTYPNDNQETDFKKHAGKGWELMNKLCNSTLISDDRTEQKNI